MIQITKPGVFLDDVVIRSSSSSPEPDVMLVNYHPEPDLFHAGDNFIADVEIMNMGSSDCTGTYTLTQYPLHLMQIITNRRYRNL